MLRKSKPELVTPINIIFDYIKELLITYL